MDRMPDDRDTGFDEAHRKARLAMLGIVLDRAKAEYAEFTDVWKQLDAKAQSVATMSASLLAAAGVAGKVGISFSTRSEKYCLVFAFACLFLSIISAISVTVIRGVPEPPLTRELFGDFKEACSEPSCCPEDLQVSFTGETITRFVKSVEAISNSTIRKSYLVSVAQILLLISVVVVSSNSLILAFRK